MMYQAEVFEVFEDAISDNEQADTRRHANVGNGLYSTVEVVVRGIYSGAKAWLREHACEFEQQDMQQSTTQNDIGTLLEEERTARPASRTPVDQAKAAQDALKLAEKDFDGQSCRPRCRPEADRGAYVQGHRARR